MPNKPNKDTVTISFTLPRLLKEAVEEFAAAELTNKSDVIRRALLSFLPADEAGKIRRRHYGDHIGHAPDGYQLPCLGTVSTTKTGNGSQSMKVMVSVPKDYGTRPHFVVQVEGNKMNPDYPAGTVIVVRAFTGDYPDPGSLIVYDDGSGMVLRTINHNTSTPPPEKNIRGIVVDRLDFR